MNPLIRYHRPNPPFSEKARPVPGLLKEKT
jgi:hypothetical protein